MTEKMLLFNRWDLSEVRVGDPGLVGHINLDPVIIPRSGGRFAPKPFQKSKVSIVERLVNKLMVSGHRGKKHKLSSGHQIGNAQGLYITVKKAFEIIESRTKTNPVQVLVMAIENSALLEEVASYRLGGIIARSSVVVSPQRRIDLALRHIAQGIQKASFKVKKSLAEVIADELILASKNDPKSFGVQERNRIEREAEGAR
jgi:small subunit ribosomal protein S7